MPLIRFMSKKWYNVDVTYIDSDDKKNCLNIGTNFMTSSALFKTRRNALTGKSEDNIYSHIPADHAYLTHATNYDHYDWNSFIESNPIAQKLKLTTPSLERKKELEEQPDEEQNQTDTSFDGSQSSAYIDFMKKCGYTDKEIAQIQQYTKAHPGQKYNISKDGGKITITPAE